MNATLAFKVETPWLQTGYEQLKELGACRWVSGVLVCFFPLENIEKVSAILGKPIEFVEADLDAVKARMPTPRENVDVPEFKGKSGFEVIAEGPKVYVVREWRKVEKENMEIKVEEIRHEVPIENVRALREALESLDERRYKNHKIPTRRVAEQVCKVLGITRFNREKSGSFDFEKFQGTRKDLFAILYYPIKVLASPQLQEIIHHKNGYITKLQDYLKYAKR